MSGGSQRFAVIGLGNFGFSLASSLARLGAEVLAVDSDQKKIDELSEKVALAVAFDCTDEQLLRANGIDKVDVAVVAIGSDFGTSVLVTRMMRDMGIEVHARATTDRESRILRAVGANHIYMPERDHGDRVARMLIHRNVEAYVPLAGGIDFVQVKPIPGMLGRTIRDMDIRAVFGLNIAYIGRVSKDGVRTYRIPSPDDVVEMGDDIFLLGTQENIENFLRSAEKD
ncbi:TrkA family potassium uptake protein [Candidatus Fermentibacteria bacterium]|nr:TrkA family potassium uptake protein [Candidatus Fermentibacteria bacterium]